MSSATKSLPEVHSGAASTLEKLLSRIAIVEAARQRIPGLAVAIGDTSGMRWRQGWGWMDPEHRQQVSAESLFRFASVSKPITATAVMRLAQHGILDLDAPIQTYVPCFPAKRWPMTCRQLLCHTAGIRHYNTEAERLNTHHFEHQSQTLERIRDDALLFEPGTQFSYSSYGYNLLGCAIEGATGLTLMDALQKEVLGPAGMSGTHAADRCDPLAPYLPGFTEDIAGRVVPAPRMDPSDRIPGGGLCGPVTDLARFGLASLDGRLLNRETWQEMCTVQRTRDGSLCGDERFGHFMGHGLGWLVYRDRAGRDIIRYGGLQAGARAMLYLLPAAGVVVAAVANKQPCDLDVLVRQMLDAIL